MRHLLGMTDLSPAEIERIFSITNDLKVKHQRGLREEPLVVAEGNQLTLPGGVSDEEQTCGLPVAP